MKSQKRIPDVTDTRRKKLLAKAAKAVAATIPGSLPPSGESALAPRIDHRTVVAMHTERALEGYKKMVDSITSKEDFAPIMIGRVKGEMVMTQLEERDGRYQIPDLKAKSRIAMFWKARRVDKIMRYLDPILKRDVGDATKVALMRKSDDDLKRLLAKLEDRRERKKTHIRNRIGCFFIEDGTDSVQL